MHSFADLMEMDPPMVVPDVDMAEAADIPVEPPEVVKKPPGVLFPWVWRK